MFKYLWLLCFPAIAACSSAGPSSRDGNASIDPQRDFMKGSIRLTCGPTCGGKWGATRKEALSYYQTESWDLLANIVMSIGHGSDQAYYYLARSAEGLGYSKAAQTYYSLSIASIYKCDGLFDICDGIAASNLAQVRLKNLRSHEDEEFPGSVEYIVKPSQTKPNPEQKTNQESHLVASEPPFGSKNLSVSAPDTASRDSLSKILDYVVQGGYLSSMFCEANRDSAAELFSVSSYIILDLQEKSITVHKGRPIVFYNARIESTNRAGMPIRKDWLIGMAVEIKNGKSEWCLSTIL